MTEIKVGPPEVTVRLAEDQFNAILLALYEGPLPASHEITVSDFPDWDESIKKVSKWPKWMQGNA